MKSLVKQISFFAAALSFCLFAAVNAADAQPSKPLTIGVANFKNCVEKSKLGKREQAAFENLKKQMDAVLEKKEKEINEIAAKFNDPDYLDSLSNEAEAELKHKFRASSQELQAQQSQYYQALSQANVKIVQMITEVVEQASAQVAKQKGLTFIVNDEACYFCSPDSDVTNLIVAEMDKIYDAQTSKNSSAEGR